MEDIKILGVDLAKNVFQLCGLSHGGKKVLERRVKRTELLAAILQSQAELVAMEACASSHHWAREILKQGMKVNLIAPQNVKPFVRRQKTDARDAEAIAVAALQDHIPRVTVKSIEQQDLQNFHRIRSRLVRQRTALINEMRGLMAEQGIIGAGGRLRFEKWFRQVRAKDLAEQILSAELFTCLEDMWQEYGAICERIERYEKRIQNFSRQSEACQRLLKIEGVGVLTASAIVAAVGTRAEGFRDAKHFSSWLGLTPRQHSSGNKELTLGISKRGDRYIRELLIHGARNVVRWSQVDGRREATQKHPRKRWILKKLGECKHHNKITVAYARKNARVIWKLLSSGENYQYAA